MVEWPALTEIWGHVPLRMRCHRAEREIGEIVANGRAGRAPIGALGALAAERRFGNGRRWYALRQKERERGSGVCEMVMAATDVRVSVASTESRRRRKDCVVRRVGRRVVRVGVADDANGRWRRSMEDVVVACEVGGGVFCGVYDGHGGREVAGVVGGKLHGFVAGEMEREGSVTSALARAYGRMEGLLEKRGYARVGCTSVTALVVGGSVYVANCGDSRCVLARSGGAVRLSEDHRPVGRERERVEKSGAFVACGRVNGILSVSRAFGDHCMKSAVVSTPFLNEVVLEDVDDFLILACDGLWDVLDDRAVVKCARLAFDQGLEAHQVASRLVRVALDAGTTDNVSVAVVQLDADD